MRFILLTILITSIGYAQDQNYLIRTVANLIDISESLSNTNPDCISLPTASPVDSINAFPTSNRQACYRPGRDPTAYSELRVGEHRLMTQDNYPRTSGPLAGVGRGFETGNYLLRRLRDSQSKPNYQIVMNVNFTGTPTLRQYMLRKTRECFREMRPYMQGPNGENLSIEIVTPDEALTLEDMPAPNQINIAVTQQPSDYRGDAGNFGSNFNCATIGHEFLHHLGLCDEYHETENAYATQWACRPITSRNSYMRNMFSTFNATVPQVSRCTCDEQCERLMNASPAIRNLWLSVDGFSVISDETSMWRTNFCREIVGSGRFLPADAETPSQAFTVKSSTPDSASFNSYSVSSPGAGSFSVYERELQCQCPPGHAFCQRLLSDFVSRAARPIQNPKCPMGTSPHALGPEIGSDSAGTHIETMGSSKVLVVSTQGSPGTSLLKPQHFRKIIAGNCTGYAQAYDQCVPYAYIPQGPQCSTMPPACNNDRFFLEGQSVQGQ